MSFFSLFQAPVFKIGKHLSTEEYQTKIVPCIVKLFSSSDRNARFKLLTQIEHFVEHLSSKIGKYSLDFKDLTELCSVLLIGPNQIWARILIF